MSFAGIIAGALGGGAQAVEQSAAADVQLQRNIQLKQAEADMDLAKMRAAEDYHIQSAENVRQARVGRINTAQEGLVAGMMQNRFGPADAAIAAANAGQTDAPLTPEQQGVIDQAMPAAKQQAHDAGMADRGTYVRAAMQTGDIDPAHLDANDARLAMMEGRSQASMYGADQRANAIITAGAGHDASRLQAVQARVAALAPRDQLVHNEVVANTAAANQLSIDIRDAEKNMVALSTADKAKAQANIDAKTAQIKAYRDRNAALFKGAHDAAAVKATVALSVPGDPTAAAAPGGEASTGGSAGVAAALEKFKQTIGQ